MMLVAVLAHELLPLAVSRAVLARARLPPTAAPRRAAPLLLRPRGSARMCSVEPAPPDLSAVLQQALARGVERERRKRASLEKEAAAATKAESLGKWAQLVISNLYRIPAGAASAVVEDWEEGGTEVTLTFDPTKGTPREEAEKAFAAARKLRRGSAVIVELLEESGRAEVALGEWATRVEESAGDEYALQTLQKQLTKRAKKLNLKPAELEGAALATAAKGGAPAAATPRVGEAASRAGLGSWGGRIFESPAGVRILVGRNRAENEQLSVKMAREPDVWMHVRGSPGAHVVLQLSTASAEARGASGDACLQRAADLAVFYSELRDAGKAVVTLASPKHVVKPSGAPLGAVRLRKEEGSLVGVPSNVPEELKELREEQKRKAWGDS